MRRLAAWLLLGLVVGMSGCDTPTEITPGPSGPPGAADWRARPISAAFGSPAGTEFKFESSSCGVEQRLAIDEGQDRVRVTLEVSGQDSGDCNQTTMLTLEEPLGNRELVDTTTSEVIEIR